MDNVPVVQCCPLYLQACCCLIFHSLFCNSFSVHHISLFITTRSKIDCTFSSRWISSFLTRSFLVAGFSFRSKTFHLCNNIPLLWCPTFWAISRNGNHFESVEFKLHFISFEYFHNCSDLLTLIMLLFTPVSVTFVSSEVLKVRHLLQINSAKHLLASNKTVAFGIS